MTYDMHGLMITNTHPIEITGLAELAKDLPDDEWYEMRIRLRKRPDGTADVYIVKTVYRLDGVYARDGEFWYRDNHDELQSLDD